jgi:hypothetical protein
MDRKTRSSLWFSRFLLVLLTTVIGMQLPSDASAATVTWAVDASGYWDEAQNWDIGTVPGPADDVVIDRPSISITVYHRYGSTLVASIRSEETLEINGGTLSASGAIQADGGLTVNGGTVQNTTVVAPAAVRVTYNDSNHLDGVTVNGDLDLATESSPRLHILNGLTLNGTATLANRAYLIFEGNQTLTAGTIVI